MATPAMSLGDRQVSKQDQKLLEDGHLPNLSPRPQNLGKEGEEAHGPRELLPVSNAQVSLPRPVVLRVTSVYSQGDKHTES